MNNYGQKLDDLYKHQKRICPACKESMPYNQNLDLHHMRPKAKWAIKKYPLFIHSLINLQLVHHNCHMCRTCGHWSDYQAEKWQLFLSKHNKIADFVNCY